MAELMAERGYATVYATPASEASTWTRNTLEQQFIQTRLLEKGVAVHSFRALDANNDGHSILSCIFTEKAGANRYRRCSACYRSSPAGRPNRGAAKPSQEMGGEWH